MDSYQAITSDCGKGFDMILRFHRVDNSNVIVSIHFGSFYFEVPEYMNKLREIKDALTNDYDLSHTFESSNDGITLSVKNDIFTYQAYRYGSNISIDLELSFQINQTLITAFDDLILIGDAYYNNDDDEDDDTDE